MKAQRRSILHVDLDPFFVSVERRLDPSLRDRAVVVGGDGAGQGFVAAASAEARQAGVRAGLPLAQVRRLCPDAAFRRGDLDAYGRASEEVTAVLLAASRRVERPSADEAFVDLTPESPSAPAPARVAEIVRDELQRRLGLDVSLGLASSRLAARIASAWARPRGLLLVLPGYELSFLAGRPISALELPPPMQAALERAGFTLLGQLAEADDATLNALGGPAAARLRSAARGENESPIASAAPPAFVQEESPIRDPRSDAAAVATVADAAARRAARRLKPLRLFPCAVTVEVRHFGHVARASESLAAGLSDEESIAACVRSLCGRLLASGDTIRGLVVRLSRLRAVDVQAPLFPVAAQRRHA